MRAVVVVLAALGCLAIAPATPASACPRCSHDSESRSLVDASFVAFDSEERVLRFRIGEGDSRRERRLPVADGVRPEHDGEAVGWDSLRRGIGFQVVVREADDERRVTRVILPTRSS